MMVSGLTHISWQHKSQTQSLLRRRKQLVGPKPGPTPEAPHSFTQQQTLDLPLFKAAEEALREEAKVSLAKPSEHLHNLTRSSHKPSG